MGSKTRGLVRRSGVTRFDNQGGLISVYAIKMVNQDRYARKNSTQMTQISMIYAGFTQIKIIKEFIYLRKY